MLFIRIWISYCKMSESLLSHLFFQLVTSMWMHGFFFFILWIKFRISFLQVVTHVATQASVSSHRACPALRATVLTGNVASKFRCESSRFFKAPRSLGGWCLKFKSKTLQNFRSLRRRNVRRCGPAAACQVLTAACTWKGGVAVHTGASVRVSA